MQLGNTTVESRQNLVLAQNQHDLDHARSDLGRVLVDPVSSFVLSYPFPSQRVAKWANKLFYSHPHLALTIA